MNEHSLWFADLPAGKERLLKVASLSLDPSVRFWVGTAVLFAALLALRLPTLWPQAAPPGADPGNWLAMAWSITGQGSRLTEWAYPPLSYLLIHGLLFFLPPLIALKVFGLGVWFGMAVAAWSVLNRSTLRLPGIFGLGLALMFMLTGFNGEIYAWGGYPQVLGMIFVILAVPALEEALLTGARRPAFVAVICSLGVIYTHHFIAAVMPVFWLLTFAWAVFTHSGQHRAIWSRFWKLALAVALPSLFAIPIYLRYVSLLAGSPTNSNGYSLKTLPVMVEYTFRELAPLWLALIIPAVLVPVLARYTRIAGPAFVFTWGTLILVTFTWEVRLLQLLILGVVFSLAALFDAAWIHPSGDKRVKRIRQVSLLVCMGLALGAVAQQGQAQFGQSVRYYQIADQPVVDGIDWLARHSAPGEIVAAYQSHLNHVNWWIEALAKRPSFSPTDQRWLSFSRERYFALVAGEIFDSRTSAQRISHLIAANQVAWVFIDKRNEEDNLAPLIQKGFLVDAYENHQVLILKVNNIQAKAGE